MYGPLTSAAPNPELASSARGVLSAPRLEQYLDGTGAARVLDREDGLIPAFEREPVRDHRREVEAAGDEVEVVLHGVLGHAVDFLDAEAVRADHPEFLEIQRRPLEAL